MSHNLVMTSTERVLWRQIVQAAFDAARAPTVEARAKALRVALKGSESLRLPDQRPLPSALFRAFLMTARGFVAETDVRLRALLATRLETLSDGAGDILDGLQLDDGAPPAWTGRADLQ